AGVHLRGFAGDLIPRITQRGHRVAEPPADWADQIHPGEPCDDLVRDRHASTPRARDRDTEFQRGSDALPELVPTVLNRLPSLAHGGSHNPSQGTHAQRTTEAAFEASADPTAAVPSSFLCPASLPLDRGGQLITQTSRGVLGRVAQV